VSDPRKMSDEEACRELARISLHEAKPGSVHVLLEAIERLRSRARMREALEEIDLWCGCHLSPGSHGDSCPSVIARRALEESDV
jgi:hypothetical protein